MGYFKAEQSLREKEWHNIWSTKIDLDNSVSFLCFLCRTLNRIPLGHILYISVEEKLQSTSKNLYDSHLNHYI